MQATFGFGKTRPAARSRILAAGYGARAMRAANARIAPVMKGVIRHIMGADVAPDLIGSPVGNRVDLYQAKFCIPFNFARSRPRGSLVAANARDPRPQLAQLATQRFDLAHIAALIGLAAPQGCS